MRDSEKEKLSNTGGAILPCFALAPLRGERNGNSIVIDVPEKCCFLMQDFSGTSIKAEEKGDKTSESSHSKRIFGQIKAKDRGVSLEAY